MRNRRQTELKVLSVLVEHGPLTWSELLKKAGVARATLSRVIKDLKNRGYISVTVKEVKGRSRVAYVSNIRNPLSTELTRFLEEELEEIKELYEKEEAEALYEKVMEIVVDEMDMLFLSLIHI